MNNTDIISAFTVGAGLNGFHMMLAFSIFILLIVFMFSGSLIAITHEIKSKASRNREELAKSIIFIFVGVSFVIAIFALFTI